MPYGDIAALEAAVDDTTVAVLLEPIQGEGGVIIPPDGYLAGVRTLCNATGVLMVADEIQSGLARTGRTFACEYEEVVPDIYVLGKALGGGLYPVSAIAADRGVLEVVTPGSHGSTFGGNPLAAAIGHEVIAMLRTGEFQERATVLGARLVAGLQELLGEGLTEVRARGLWAGVDIDPELRPDATSASSSSTTGSWPRRRTVRRSGWPRRWSRRRTTSTSSSARSARSAPADPPSPGADPGVRSGGGSGRRIRQVDQAGRSGRWPAARQQGAKGTGHVGDVQVAIEQHVQEQAVAEGTEEGGEPHR